MTPLAETIIAHGGSFERVPNKAFFWLPGDGAAVCKEELFRVLEADGHQIRVVREEGGWVLYRFVGRRRPGRVIKVNDRSAMHGISSRLVIEVLPNGTVTVHESGRRVKYVTTVAAIYRRCLEVETFKQRMAKAKARADKRKARKP